MDKSTPAPLPSVAMRPDAVPTARAPASSGTLRRLLPIALLLAAMGVAYKLGLHELVSFKTIGTNYDALRDYVTAHLPTALALYVTVYVLVVALSLPGGLIMTLAGGLLFGWVLGAAATVVAATVGATIVFLIAKTSFGEPLAAKAGPWLSGLREGFQKNALSYLLFLRLVPAFPFVVVNLAPALLGVSLSTYMVGTVLGIIPGTIAFSIAGSGLGSVVEAQNRSYQECVSRVGSAEQAACPYTIDTGALVTPQLLAAMAALGFIALLPVVLQRWRGRHGTN